MNIEQVREYTLSLPGVTEDQPFGDDIITFRLEGKIFVCLWIGGGKYDMKDGEPRLALKLAPERNEELRAQFSAVTPAYHWNKKHWSDVYYEQLDDTQVEEWIQESCMNLIMGIIGSYVGTFISLLLNIELLGKGYLTNCVFCVVGAVTVLWIWKKLFD